MATADADRAILPLPLHAQVSEEPATYLIQLDVSGFDDAELDLTLHGHLLTVVGEHSGAAGERFGVHERLEETFSLPDDVVTDRIEAFSRGDRLEIRAPRARAWCGVRRVPVHRANGVINADATPC
jgi:HSP20 family molecular chaperone IbpA